MTEGHRFLMRVSLAFVGGWMLLGWRGAVAALCIFLIWGPTR